MISSFPNTACWAWFGYCTVLVARSGFASCRTWVLGSWFEWLTAAAKTYSLFNSKQQWSSVTIFTKYDVLTSRNFEPIFVHGAVFFETFILNDLKLGWNFVVWKPSKAASFRGDHCRCWFTFRFAFVRKLWRNKKLRELSWTDHTMMCFSFLVCVCVEGFLLFLSYEHTNVFASKRRSFYDNWGKFDRLAENQFW